MIEENQDESLVPRFQQYLSCVFAAIALSTSAFSAETSQTTECSLKQLASIDVKVDNKVLIPVSFGDRRTFLALSTANSLSIISKKVVDDFRLQLGPAPLHVLRHLRIYFATKEHILYITAADAG